MWAVCSSPFSVFAQQAASPNKEIDLLATQTETKIENLTETVNTSTSQIRQDINSVNLSVSNLQTTTQSNIDNLSAQYTSLLQETQLKVDSESVNIIVENRIDQGVDKVVTTQNSYRY